MNEFNVLIKGGTMRFWGEWFGRPFDNYHTIIKATHINDCITIEFDGGEKLIILNPSEIVNENKKFSVKDAKKVVWTYIPYGSHNSKVHEYVYEHLENGKFVKSYNGIIGDFHPRESIAVECLSY